MAKKTRFGYFSIPPSHRAAVTDYSKKKGICSFYLVVKDESGKVKTYQRNIYSGTNSTGSLRKNYFSYVPSAFHGSPYEDPGKFERKQNLLITQKWSTRGLFKPAKLNKTL